MITDPHRADHIDIAGAKVPVWIYGDKSKPLIYFIHGYFRGFSEYIGDLPMRYLMKDYCIIAFDLPGFGHLEEMQMDRIRFIAEVIEKTSEGRKFVLFGGSYGGLLALEYAKKYPDKVKGIILGGMPYFYGFRKLLNASYLLPLVRRKNISSIIKEFSFLNRFNLEQIKTPVLLLYSKKDRHATYGMGKRINQQFPNSKLFTIDKYNHGWLMHRIDESGFLKEIEKFIKSLN